MADSVQCGFYMNLNGGLCYSYFKGEDSNEVEVLKEEREELKKFWKLPVQFLI